MAHPNAGDGRDYVRVDYRYVVADSTYDRHFIATSDLARVRERFARGRRFRYCYAPRFPGLGYVPNDGRPCGG